ncbi:MAG: methyltransferase domain-containing protein [candidate division Zixibacteria bacterium]|nr:methyltransferase domain-containing protein [candidate division Zixibacteria bacterium]
MEACKYHIYICTQEKPPGAPSCAANGAFDLLDKLQKEIVSLGLENEVQVTPCGSFGLCDRGPNMVIYPDGIWYSKLTPGDIPEIVEEHLKNGKIVERLANLDESDLRSTMEANKRKKMAAMKARDEAGVLPDDFMQNLRGFMESRILLTSLELDIHTHINKGATAPELAGKIGTDPRATDALLNALVAIGTLIKDGEIFENSPMAERFLSRDADDSARDALMHIANLWSRWDRLTDCVREGTSVTYRDMNERGDEWTNSFIALMHRNARLRAPIVVKAVGAEGIRKMLDIGGGSGAYSLAFAKANDNLEADVFDLPAVIPLAEKYINEGSLSHRVKTIPGDFRDDDFGSGYDLVFLSAICHMNGPEENVELFNKSLNALEPGGKIVMQDFILNSDRTSPKQAALFAINMLVGTRKGGSYTEEEYREWMIKAGFKEIKHIDLPGPTGLITGIK